MTRFALILALLTLAMGATAEVVSVDEHGFGVRHSRAVAAAPEEAYRVLTGEVSQWWESAHTWSGEAANLSIEARPGGCFCERLPEGGWVEHLRIVYLAPGKAVRLRGALGPLGQMGLDGAMSWTIEPAEGGGATLGFSYIVNGHLPGGFEGLAPVVDGVIGAQIDALAALLASD